MTNNNSIVPAFGYAHPFWIEAVSLRKEYKPITEIHRLAVEAGYNLTYKQISLGLSRAPVNLNLPASSSRSLRKKYEHLEESFNSFTSMRDLAQEALAKAAEYEESLEDEELTTARRSFLQHERDKWLKTAFDWSKECSRIEVDIGTILSAQEKQEKPKESVTPEMVKSIITEFHANLPTTNAEDLAKKYGGDNVRVDDVEEHDTESEEF